MKAAAESGRWRIVDLIWNNAIVRNGDQSFFRTAIENGDIEIAKYLLKNDYPHVDSSHFIATVKHGDTELLKAIISACRSRGTLNGPGSAALCNAVLRDDSAIVDLLLSEKVRICVGDETPTALDFALETNNTKILERLLESAAKNDVLYQDCLSAYEHLMESARAHERREDLLSMIENSHFGKTKGESNLGVVLLESPPGLSPK